MRNQITRSETFHFTGWQAVPGKPEVVFHYHCSRFGGFQEMVSFPALEGASFENPDQGLAGLFTLLHLALGVSYYKCAAAEEIILPGDLGNAAADVARALYTEGLAEFFIRAGLPFPPDLRFSQKQEEVTTGKKMPSPASPSEKRHALVAFGGGKDSYVAEAIVRHAGITPELCSVVMSDKVAATIQETAPRKVTFLHRQLDPALRTANENGAFNGHVPITAINSLMLVIHGRLTGAGHVIFANERSADEPTIQMEGGSANHQFSKSSQFEELLRRAIAETDPQAPDYFSLLRPYSEIWIGQTFASLKTPFDRFTSCNRNFQITGKDSPRWCGDCAKCAFTSLILAPFLPREEMLEIFPDIFPDRKNLLPVYRELCGLTENKPWDCVGTINECRASVFRLGQQPDWQETLLVKQLLPEILKENTPEELEKFWEEGLAAQDRHFVPASFLKAAHAL